MTQVVEILTESDEGTVFISIIGDSPIVGQRGSLLVRMKIPLPIGINDLAIYLQTIARTLADKPERAA